MLNALKPSAYVIMFDNCRRFLRIRMQPHRHHAPTKMLSQAVVVVPTVRPALVGIEWVRTRSSGTNTGLPDSIVSCAVGVQEGPGPQGA